MGFHARVTGFRTHEPSWKVWFDQFSRACVAESPVTKEEIAGVTTYAAPHAAQVAKYFAWSPAHNVTHGDSNAEGNARSVAEMRAELERLLTALE